MLRLHDTRTGRLEPVAASGVVRMRSHGVRGLRAALLPDLIRRVLEVRRVRVFTTGPALEDGFLGECAALNIRPADSTTPGPPGSGLPDSGVSDSEGALVVSFGSAGSAAEAGRVESEHRLLVAPMLVEGVAVEGGEAAGLDPLALRMAMLERHYREPAALGWDELQAADTALRRWRARVADWAESPSAPMARERVERVLTAVEEDLDTPGALRELQELERDPEVAAGAKLESFLHLDRVLGLDLPVEIGKR
ncbi:hypothetical protein [Nonomuraea longicatena]|uniref:Cysteinyl-tRNA synthetase n=1 Tax=Nonomuraea longicatena TaxID=83682 RepID=A0ABN1R168_9ACTN